MDFPSRDLLREVFVGGGRDLSQEQVLVFAEPPSPGQGPPGTPSPGQESHGVQGPVGMQLCPSHPSIPDDLGGCFHPLLSSLVSLSHLEERSLAKTNTNTSLSPVPRPLAVLEAETALQGDV